MADIFMPQEKGVLAVHLLGELVPLDSCRGVHAADRLGLDSRGNSSRRPRTGGSSSVTRTMTRTSMPITPHMKATRWPPRTSETKVTIKMAPIRIHSPLENIAHHLLRLCDSRGSR